MNKNIKWTKFEGYRHATYHQIVVFTGDLFITSFVVEKC